MISDRIYRIMQNFVNPVQTAFARQNPQEAAANYASAIAVLTK